MKYSYQYLPWWTFEEDKSGLLSPVEITTRRNNKNESTPVRFELTHTLYTALAGHRLNHSAKVPCLGDGSETPIEYKYHLRFEKHFTQRRGNAETEDLTS